MTRSSPVTDHWSVTTRTQGAVQSAVASLPSIEMALLGIPEGFTAGEIQSWLRDLAGVAIETSRTDERSRPIPQLLHHVLTGLLFSQTELWSHTGQALPCAAVFVETPQGTAFGWVGRARVVLLVNGEPLDPQWVIVRDESGQEAMSAMLPPQSHVLLTLEYWPHSEAGQQAPASVDAEWGQSLANRGPGASEPARATSPSASAPRPTASPMPATPLPFSPEPPAPAPSPAPGPSPVEIVASAPVAPAPSASSPPTDRPGLAPDPTRSLSLDEPDDTQSLPSTYHASSSTFAMPSVPGASRPGEPAGDATTSVPRPETELTRGSGSTSGAGEPGHPVGRWLTRIMDFAKKAMPAQESGAETGAPRLPVRTRAAESPPVLSPVRPAGPAQPPVLSRPAASQAHAEREPAAPAPPTVASSMSSGNLAQQPRAVSPPVVKPVLSVPPPPPTLPPAMVSPLPAPGPAPANPASTSQTPPAHAPAVSRPLAAPPHSRSGLLPVGLDDILGSRASVAPAKSATPAAEARGTMPTPATPVSPAAPTSSKPPYPVLGAKPPATAQPPRGPIQIEREPVGASAEFAIPKLPPRDAPKPFRVPLPTAADMVRPAAPAPATRSPASPQPAAPLTPAAPGPPTPSGTETAVRATPAPVPPTPAATTAGSAPHPPAPALPARSSAPVPQVPEPPADFLAEFAASLGADIQDVVPDVVPPAPPPVAEPRRPAPPLPSVKRAVANVPPITTPVTGHFIAPLPSPIAPPVAPLEPAVPPPVLGTPSEEMPISVSQSELPGILRELPLAPSGQPDAGDIPDGMLVATPAGGQRSRRGHWPAVEELEPARTPVWRNPWLLGAFVAVLFSVGWIVGHAQAPDNDINATPLSRMLRAVGLSGARFTASVDSDPPGAIISVDGKDTGRRTPSVLELVPGSHKITLSMPDLGQVDVDLKGSRGQKLKVSEALHGSLEVTALDKSLPVKVSLDGEPMGFLPLTVEKLPPGLHEVQFSGPNMQPWAQNVSVPIRGIAAVKARPMMSPATGVLQVQAILNDEGGSAPLSGASVFVDGELRGSTPETLELPRGPHSIRVTYRGAAAPVQVIDLPGGNRRFAQFQFGLDSDLPPLKLKSDYATLPARKQALIEASLDGLDWKDVREAWLHVRSSEGLWRRYQVTIEEGPRGTELSAFFPQAAGEAGSRVHWYMSAATSQGDDFYTEMQRSMR